jgi:hypothetical protein
MVRVKMADHDGWRRFEGDGGSCSKRFPSRSVADHLLCVHTCPKSILGMSVEPLL